MDSFFTFLAENPYILLFFTVGMAVWVGKFSVKGYGLGLGCCGRRGRRRARDLGFHHTASSCSSTTSPSR
jgi:hypothetical protein